MGGPGQSFPLTPSPSTGCRQSSATNVPTPRCKCWLPGGNQFPDGGHTQVPSTKEGPCGDRDAPWGYATGVTQPPNGIHPSPRGHGTIVWE